MPACKEAMGKLKYSPIAFQHIHLTRHYTFTDDKPPIDLDITMFKV